mgnify:CR=1 FL=1
MTAIFWVTPVADRAGQREDFAGRCARREVDRVVNLDVAHTVRANASSENLGRVVREQAAQVAVLDHVDSRLGLPQAVIVAGADSRAASAAANLACVVDVDVQRGSQLSSQLAASSVCAAHGQALLRERVFDPGELVECD